MDFSEVYQRYVHDVHRFSLYLSGNYALAEDLTSETFVHAFCGRADLRVGTVKAYLLAIARNLYRDFLLRQRRMVPMDAMPERVDPAPRPDQTAADRQTFAIVMQAMQALPATQREALLLAADKDLRQEQIAAILGCSIVAAKVRIHRARVALKAQLNRKEQTWKT